MIHITWLAVYLLKIKQQIHVDMLRMYTKNQPDWKHSFGKN